MRIGLVVQPLERTPPYRYGAVERIVGYLADELVERGHDVTLFASGDSDTRARLIGCANRALLHDADYVGERWWVNNIQIAQVIERQRDFDVINSHAGYAFLPATHALSTPVVTTWHGRMHLPVTHDMLSYYRHTQFISICRHQQREAPAGTPWIANVPNGIPDTAIPYRAVKKDYLLFLGRITPAKHPDLAVRAAARAGIPLRLAGRIAPSDRDYFEGVVQPLLRQVKAEYLGEILDADKRNLLADAYALLHPSEWEACSVSLIEAHAAGTPCIALDRGGNSEIIEHGQTGYVFGSEQELLDSRLDVSGIDPARCRSRYKAEFTVDRMTERALAAFASACSPEAAR